MDFKYAKNSITLENLQAEMKAKEEQERKRAKQNKIARMKKDGYFLKAHELIDWVLSGKRIVDGDDPCEWMQLIDGKIIHQYLEYNDIDMPIGYFQKTMSVEQFKEWVANCEEEQIKEHKVFVNEYFHRDI